MSKQIDESFSQLHGTVVDKLAGAVDGGIALTTEERSHLEQCVICQAEVVNYRKLLRTLHDLRTQIINPAPGLLADVLAGIAEKGERRAVRSMVTGRRVAYASGLAVATVAGVTGAVLLAGWGKSRSPKKAA